MIIVDVLVIWIGNVGTIGIAGAKLNGYVTCTLTKHPGPLYGDPLHSVLDDHVVLAVTLLVFSSVVRPRTYVWIESDVAGQPVTVQELPRTIA